MSIMFLNYTPYAIIKAWRFIETGLLSAFRKLEITGEITEICGFSR